MFVAKNTFLHSSDPPPETPELRRAVTDAPALKGSRERAATLLDVEVEELVQTEAPEVLYDMERKVSFLNTEVVRLFI